MSIVTPDIETSSDKPLAPPVPLWRISVEKYHEMIRKGVLAENDRVELLDGWLVEKMPTNPPHRTATTLVREALQRVLPAGWYMDAQAAITLDTSEPEPDVAVVRGEVRDYVERHPEPADVGLVVEVSDTSLSYDRGLKKTIYARAGIGVYWIVNLVDRRLEVYSEPTKRAEYARHDDYGPEDQVSFVLDGVEIARILVSDLLP